MNNMNIEPIFGLVTDDQIREIEERLSFTIPEKYFQFLSKYNGGIPEFSSFIITGENDQSQVLVFYGIKKGATYDLLNASRSWKKYLPTAFLPIASDAGGNQIVLDCNPENAGAIYFMDHEAHPGKNLTKIADSFTAFVESLH